jgi:hypothetical protein
MQHEKVKGIVGSVNVAGSEIGAVIPLGAGTVVISLHKLHIPGLEILTSVGTASVIISLPRLHVPRLQIYQVSFNVCCSNLLPRMD